MPRPGVPANSERIGMVRQGSASVLDPLGGGFGHTGTLSRTCRDG